MKCICDVDDEVKEIEMLAKTKNDCDSHKHKISEETVEYLPLTLSWAVRCVVSDSRPNSRNTFTSRSVQSLIQHFLNLYRLLGLDEGHNNIIFLKTRNTEVLHPQPNSITIQTAMAQSVPPGDTQTQPTKIVFNAPNDTIQSAYLTVINPTNRCIAFALKGTSMHRLGVEPPCGVLDPNKAVLLDVSCDAFAHGQEDTNNDRITVVWTNIPDGAAKQFRREWFQEDDVVRRKELPIEYYKTNEMNLAEQKSPEDPTQSGKSGESSPEITLSSKLRHMEIRKAEAEENEEKKEEKVDKSKNFPTIALKSMLDHITPYCRSIFTREETHKIEYLISQRLHRAEAHKIPAGRVQRLIVSLCGSVLETIREAYETKEEVIVTVKTLTQQTEEFLRKLNVSEAVKDMGVFKVEESEINTHMKFTTERVLRSVISILKEA